MQMIKDAVAKDVPIAIGFIDDPNKIAPVGPGETIGFVNQIVGYGKVQVVEERQNGFLLVFLHGLGKARLGTVQNSATPYLVCEATPIAENLIPNPALHEKIHLINRVLAKWITDYFSNSQQSEMFLRQLDGPEAIISAFSAYLVKDFDLQQIVLEMDDINEKIEFLYRLILSNGTI